MKRVISAIVLTAGLVSAQGVASAQVVTTIAGSGQVGSADGQGTAASFSGPLGVAADPSGVLYVADSGSLKIRKITHGGLVTTLAGSGYRGYEAGPGETARFFGPLGIAADPLGNVWVADSDDGIDGQFLKSITPAGVVQNLRLYPGYSPSVLAFGDGGDLYVSDLFAGLWKIAADDKHASRIDANRAQGLTVDTAGNIYLIHENRIDKIGVDGSATTLAGSDNRGSANGRGTQATFRDPTGLAVDKLGNVYVADRGNHKIRKITSAGFVSTVAGSGRPGKSDGAGATASFNLPTGVAVGPMGDLYVADTGNNVIRRISTGTVCMGSSGTLSLNGLRVTLCARDARTGQTAGGVAIPVNDVFGYFTIPELTFNPQSPEVFVKILDGRPVNGSFWVFHGGLTDLEYTLTVLEPDSGRIRTYLKPAGSACGEFDTAAF